MKNLANAIIAVMNEVSNIEKNMTVGSGNSSYKGVADKDVKEVIGNAMAKHGLCILPIEYNTKFQVDRWEESSQYGTKTKQNIFTEVNSKYLLLHVSGESQVVSGLGHGVDSQDKSAGKATTYSLKNLLLNLFLVPTGKIDDTDTIHSDDLPVPAKATAPKVSKIITAEQLKAHEEKIGIITEATGLSGYYKALPDDLKSNEQIQNLLRNRREKLTI